MDNLPYFLLPSKLLSQVLPEQIKQLDAVRQELSDDDQRVPRPNDQREVLARFWAGFSGQAAAQPSWSSFKLRTLLFASGLTNAPKGAILSDAAATRHLIQLLQLRSSSRLLRVAYLKTLESWGHPGLGPGLDLLRAYVRQEAERHRGKDDRYAAIHAARWHTLDGDGANRLAKRVYEARADPGFEYYRELVALPSSASGYAYVEEVVCKLIEQASNDFAYLDKYREALIGPYAQNLSVLQRYGLALYTAAAQTPAEHAGEIWNTLQRTLGDPLVQRSRWTPDRGLSARQKDKLVNAREALTAYLSRAAIRAFFTVCATDKVRERAWLKYADKITDFRVLGSVYNLRTLTQLEDIGPVVKARYHVASGNNAAFVIWMGRHQFVEYGGTGDAMYAYLQGTSNEFSHERLGSIINVKDLKRPSVSRSMVGTQRGGQPVVLATEGRLFHKHDWTKVFHAYMKQHVLPYV